VYIPLSVIGLIAWVLLQVLVFKEASERYPVGSWKPFGWLLLQIFFPIPTFLCWLLARNHIK